VSWSKYSVRSSFSQRTLPFTSDPIVCGGLPGGNVRLTGTTWSRDATDSLSMGAENSMRMALSV
jgi:hypothetical protein